MVKKCIVCRSKPDERYSRTFHMFPKGLEKRKKWLNALKITKTINFKTAHVCSDHFDETSFCRPNDETLKRRLRSDCLPRLIQSNENATNTTSEKMELNSNVITLESHLEHEESANFTFEKSLNTDSHKITANENINESVESVVEDLNGDEQKSDVNREEDLIITEDSRKRPRSLSVDIRRPRKRIRFTRNGTTEYISRDDFVSDLSWEKFMRFTINERSKTAVGYCKISRNKKKVSSLQDVIKSLKEKEELNAAEYMMDLPPHVQELLIRMKNRKPTAPFPPNLKNFARTLHFHSPAAYEAVRKSFLNCLPCTQTLNKWYCSKDYKPGISEEIIDKISNIVKSEEEKGRSPVFNVTFDEMHIKQHKEWDKITHTWKGLVDLGGQLNEIREDSKKNSKEDTEKDSQHKVASKALVFMLVNINGGFKAPVSHYLTNSLNGAEKAILLKDLLVKLHEKKINVVSVTFDGDKSHRTACEKLGANLNYKNKETFKPYFEHPVSSEPVYIFYDPCHCLKLVRNYFGTKGPIIYKKKQFIDWEFIKKLQIKQGNENLHCACKIRKRHVYFHKEKMKVFLAAQVLSNSTSCALNFLENDLKDKDFKNSSATATFCKNINDIFDLLNVRNKFCKTPGRSSICADSLGQLKEKVDVYVNYIENLEINVRARRKKENCDNNNNNYSKLIYTRKSVVETDSVNTGFVGFIICLQNLYSLSKYLIERKIVNYFLSYKLSQDHVEMFFSTIRRMNGFNNNPTTTQYLSAYKKILLNNSSIAISAHANCSPLDATILISDAENVEANSIENIDDSQLSTTGKSGMTEKQSIKVADFFPSKDFQNDFVDHLNECSEYAEEVIKYIAGAVVRIVKSKIHCDSCCDLLDQNKVKSKLTKLKNRGGLIFASEDVYLICKRVEQTVRCQKNLFDKRINFKIITETLKTLPSSILDDKDHCFQQEPLMDHRHQLILLIIQTYVDLRLKHEGTICNDKQQRVRMQNNKTTIFSGQ